MAYRVLVYEDNEDLRKSIQVLLIWNNNFDIVAALPDANSVIEDISVLKPDIVLMDIDMPGNSGIDALTQIRELHTGLPVVMFTVFEDDENIFNAICAGANGYILKKDVSQIPAAISDVMNGGAPMTSSVAKKVLGFIPKQRSKNKPLITETLTDRETQVLELIVKGYSYKMIAGELQMALETVRTHIKKVYKKLQVNSATEASFKYSKGRN